MRNRCKRERINTVPKRYSILVFASPIARVQGILWARRVQQRLEMELPRPIAASRRILSYGAPNRCSGMPVADLIIRSRNSKGKTHRITIPYIFAQRAALQATGWRGSDATRTELCQIFGRKYIDGGLGPENNTTFKEISASRNKNIL